MAKNTSVVHCNVWLLPQTSFPAMAIAVSVGITPVLVDHYSTYLAIPSGKLPSHGIRLLEHTNCCGVTTVLLL